MIGSILPNSILLLATLQTLNLAQNLGGFVGIFTGCVVPAIIEFSSNVSGSFGKRILFSVDNSYHLHFDCFLNKVPEYFMFLFDLQKKQQRK
jgi:hypothetical protein